MKAQPVDVKAEGFRLLFLATGAGLFIGFGRSECRLPKPGDKTDLALFSAPPVLVKPVDLRPDTGS